MFWSVADDERQPKYVGGLNRSEALSLSSNMASLEVDPVIAVN